MQIRHSLTVMDLIRVVAFSIFIGGVWPQQDLDFPPGFKFGVASSSYQVEGAWNVSNKSESVWDRFAHEHPEKIQDGSNGDVASDSYHQWKRDIGMASELGVHFYRFSISWTRLLPTGFPNRISEDGKTYYNNLIDGLLAKNIEPMVTLYHWDLPQRLQNLGGWANPYITEWYADYARIAFTLFGDRVKTWITINEPIVFCETSYNSGDFAPGIVDSNVGTGLCVKHALLAHAKAWRIYDEEFRHKYHGELTLANHLFWYEPYSKEDEELTELVHEYANGRYSHPVYSKEGGWPVNITKAMALNSKRQGYIRSTLPTLTKHEIEFIKGTYDFYAFNHYSSRAVRKARKDEMLLPAPLGDIPELNAKLLMRREWPTTASSWFAVNPQGIRKQLNWLKQEYGDLKYIITENGYSSTDGLVDVNRIHYYREHLKQVLLAIKEDGINVMGYTAWSLMDSYEWASGYQVKFGLYEVDFASSDRTRRPRTSAHYYRNIIKAHSLNVSIPKVQAVPDGAVRVIPSILLLNCIILLTKYLL